MEPSSPLRHMRVERDALRNCLDGDPAAPVEHCGDWTLLDLAEHVGSSNLRVAAVATEQRGEGTATNKRAAGS